MDIFEYIVIILSSSLLGAVLSPIISSIYETSANIKYKKWQQKEERFFKAVTYLGGFRFPQKMDVDQQEKFYEAYRQLWLYANDDTIKKMNEIYHSMGAKRVPYEKLSDLGKAQCDMMIQIRKEFYGKTSLTNNDYRIVVYSDPNKNHDDE